MYHKMCSAKHVWSFWTIKSDIQGQRYQYFQENILPPIRINCHQPYTKLYGRSSPSTSIMSDQREYMNSWLSRIINLFACVFVNIFLLVETRIARAKLLVSKREEDIIWSSYCTTWLDSINQVIIDPRRKRDQRSGRLKLSARLQTSA